MTAPTTARVAPTGALPGTAGEDATAPAVARDAGPEARPAATGTRGQDVEAAGARLADGGTVTEGRPVGSWEGRPPLPGGGIRARAARIRIAHGGA